MPFPEKTSRNIGRACNKNIIRTLGGILGLTKIILDHVVHIQVGLGIFDNRKLERFRRPKRNFRWSRDQRGRRSRGRSHETRSWGRSRDTRRRWRGI